MCEGKGTQGPPGRHAVGYARRDALEYQEILPGPSGLHIARVSLPRPRARLVRQHRSVRCRRHACRDGQGALLQGGLRWACLFRLHLVRMVVDVSTALQRGSLSLSQREPQTQISKRECRVRFRSSLILFLFLWISHSFGPMPDFSSFFLVFFHVRPLIGRFRGSSRVYVGPHFSSVLSTVHVQSRISRVLGTLSRSIAYFPRSAQFSLPSSPPATSCASLRD